MKIYISTITLALIVSGCVSTSTSLTTKAKQALQSTQGYKVGKVNVTLVKNTFYDFSEEQKLYPNTEKLATYFKNDMQKYLKKSGKSCQDKQECLTVDMNINYTRNFNLKSVTVSAPKIDRTVIIHKGEKVFYTDTKKELQPSRGGLLGKALNEVSVFTKVGKNTPNLQDERKDIDVISDITIKEIVSLGN